MIVKFTNFPKEFKILKKELNKKFNKIGSKGHYVLGEELKNFETNVQKFLKVKHVLGVGNWTEGTVMVLKALGYKRGDEIITVSNSFIATCGAIAYEGLVPKLVDVGDDLNIDVKKIEKKITKKTKAIMPVHLSGIPSDLDQLNKICKKKKLHLIEDAAHAFGTKYKNNYIGTIGDVGIFSLHPRKNFHVLGDGGIIVTKNKKLFKKLLLLRNHGLKNRDEVLIPGYNSRLDTFQAVIGNWIIPKAKSIAQTRINNAKYLDKHLSKIKEISIPPRKKNFKIVFHLYIVFAQHRDLLLRYCLKKGIEAKIHYPIPIYKQQAYKYLKNNYKDFPITNSHLKKIITFPCDQHKSKKELNYIIKTVSEFYK